MNIWIITTPIKFDRVFSLLGQNADIDSAIKNVNKNLLYGQPVRHLYLEGKKRHFNVDVLTPSEISFIVQGNNQYDFFVKGVPVSLPDFVIPRTGSGTNDAAISIYKSLEAASVPMLNSSQSIYNALDKFLSLQKLSQHHLPIPKSMMITSNFKFNMNETAIGSNFSFPLIVKTWPGSNGSGVMLAHDRYNLEDIITMIRKANPSANIMIQEYITASRGRDIRVVVLNGKVIHLVERNAMDGGFKSNFAREGIFKPIPDNEQVKKIAIAAAKCLDLEFTGVDILYTEEGYKICELNSAPGFSSMEVFGINPSEIVFDYLTQKNQEVCAG